MAIIDDLKIPSITNMSPDEAIEYLRVLRLSRNTPKKNRQSKSTIEKKAKAKAIPKPSKSQALELLKLLGG